MYLDLIDHFYINVIFQNERIKGNRIKGGKELRETNNIVVNDLMHILIFFPQALCQQITIYF